VDTSRGFSGVILAMEPTLEHSIVLELSLGAVDAWLKASRIVSGLDN